MPSHPIPWQGWRLGILPRLQLTVRSSIGLGFGVKFPNFSQNPPPRARNGENPPLGWLGAPVPPPFVGSQSSPALKQGCLSFCLKDKGFHFCLPMPRRNGVMQGHPWRVPGSQVQPWGNHRGVQQKQGWSVPPQKDNMQISQGDSKPPT